MDRGDAEILRALRLQALSDAPDAFGSTYEREAARTTSDWQRWFSPGAAFVLEIPISGAVGLAAGNRDEHDPAVVHLMSMWVHPAFRKRGGASALVAEVLSWAESERAEVVRLHVVKGNDTARRLYERHGFQSTGNEIVRERDGNVEIEMQRRFA